MEKKKVYVHSGELRGVIMCDSPMNACLSLLNKFGGGKTLDSTWFLVDERGFRDRNEAKWAVPVKKVLAAAGYVYEDEDGGEECA